MKKIMISTLIIFSLVGTKALAQQTLDDKEIIDIENLYKESKPPASPEKKVNQESLLKLNQVVNEQNSLNQKKQINKITDLNELAPFSDIAVIQKKYLPKTGRFQLYTAAGLTTNSPWFLNLGAKANLSYHFTENFGVEISGMFFSSSETESAKEIREYNSLQPDKFVLTKSNVSLDIIWSPIYGKMADLNQKIIPFDMYFSFGGGVSGTNSQEGSVPTLHVGLGQIFAISKTMAFRWDYSWNNYQATPVVVGTSTPSKGSFSDLIFTAGLSFFFPEVSDR